VPLVVVVSAERHEVFRDVVPACSPGGDVVGLGRTGAAGEAGEGAEGGEEFGILDPRGFGERELSLVGIRHCRIMLQVRLKVNRPVT
jgi:hypothetical protein